MYIMTCTIQLINIHSIVTYLWHCHSMQAESRSTKFHFGAYRNRTLTIQESSITHGLYHNWFLKLCAHNTRLCWDYIQALSKATTSPVGSPNHPSQDSMCWESPCMSVLQQYMMLCKKNFIKKIINVYLFMLHASFIGKPCSQLNFCMLPRVYREKRACNGQIPKSLLLLNITFKPTWMWHHDKSTSDVMQPF